MNTLPHVTADGMSCCLTWLPLVLWNRVQVLGEHKTPEL